MQSKENIWDNTLTHKGWDCKDDLKVFEYDDPKCKSSLLTGRYSFDG